MSKLFVNTIAPNSGDTVTLSGSLVTTGKLTIGDASTDTVAFSAEISSSILPDASATYDLGTMAKAWRNLHAHGLGHIHTASINIVSSSLIPDGDDVYDLGSSTKQWKDLYVDGVAYIDTASINRLTVVDHVSGNLIPNTHNTANLGTTEKKWKEIHGFSAYFSLIDNVSHIDANTSAFNELGSSLFPIDTASFNQSGAISGSFNPLDNNSWDLGSNTNKWKDINLGGTASISFLFVNSGSNFKGHVSITGSVSTSGSISANGNISSSGVIYGTTLGINNYDAVNSTGTTLRLGYDSNLTALTYGKDSDTSHLFYGAITASGNISASNVVLTGNVTASGNISASNINATTISSTVFIGTDFTGTASLANTASLAHTASNVNFPIGTAASQDLSNSAIYTVHGPKVEVKAITAASISDGAFAKFSLHNPSIAANSLIYGAFTGNHSNTNMSSSIISVATIGERTASVFIHNETGGAIAADTPFTASFVIL